jgi:O-acetyl-ADP-ribose deacetylase (regulator of RNase III)
MISYVKGDLLSADVDAVVNTVNTVGVMGKGIALQFKRRYPENYAIYRAACLREQVRLGSMFITETHEIIGPRLIVNFPTKGHWKADSRISDIRAGLKDLVSQIGKWDIKSIAIPPLGAGNGNLDWRDVKPLIEQALADVDGLDVRVYEPAQAYRAIVGKPLRLTPTRALTLELLARYVEKRQALEPWEDPTGVSHLEIQKLLYFADRAQPELNLRFTMGMYGPYSDVVRHIVQDMEGTYVAGFGDGSDDVLSLTPIHITERAIAELTAYRQTDNFHAAVDDVTEAVLGRISEFEGPYLLELLSSVDWAINEGKVREESAAVNFVQEWTARKSRIFTTAHIGAAFSQLVAS